MTEEVRLFVKIFTLAIIAGIGFQIGEEAVIEIIYNVLLGGEFR